MVSTQLLSIRKNIIFIMQFRNGIWLPDGDTWIHWGEKWERGQYKKLKLRGNLCLDIGAHVGIWTKRLSTVFQKVICFEPVKSHVECWRENCKGIKNVEIHEVGVSDKIDTVDMKVMQHNSGESTLQFIPDRTRTGKIEKVNLKTIDYFNFSKVSFVKIDVEGHELFTLKGAINTLKKCRPTIFIEIHNKELRKENNAYKFLCDLGYYEICKFNGSNFLLKYCDGT